MAGFPILKAQLLSAPHTFDNNTTMTWSLVFLSHKDKKTLKNNWPISYCTSKWPYLATVILSSISILWKERQNFILPASAFSPWINLKTMLLLGLQWLNQALATVKSTLPITAARLLVFSISRGPHWCTEWTRTHCVQHGMLWHDCPAFKWTASLFKVFCFWGQTRPLKCFMKFQRLIWATV